MEIDSPLQKEFSNNNVMCLLTDPEGTPLGAPISLPQSTGPIQLQELVNNLLKNEDKVPYAFYISDKELVVQLGTYLEKNKGHTEAVLCVSFSPDGRHLASGSGDTTVRLWDLNTQTPLFTCTGADTKMAVEEELVKNNDREVEIKKNKRKKRLLREAENAKNRGVCYFSRIPPRMDPTRFRQILSQYGEIDRIYLTPENPAAQLHRKRAGGFRGQNFSEGWVEFISKSVAKRVAHALNGEQIGGKKKSQFYYDLWNIKYLSKFKWDDLTEEIAYKMASREQKLALELSAATRERDFYLSKVDKSRALASIQERMKKKQKISEEPDKETEPKVIRHFPQTRPVSDTSSQSKKLGLSKEVLAGVFGGSS